MTSSLSSLLAGGKYSSLLLYVNFVVTILQGWGDVWHRLHPQTEIQISPWIFWIKMQTNPPEIYLIVLSAECTRGEHRGSMFTLNYHCGPISTSQVTWHYYGLSIIWYCQQWNHSINQSKKKKSNFHCMDIQYLTIF